MSISHIFPYVPLLGKFFKKSSFHGNQISGIYGEKSRTKHSIDIPNGYFSEQNGMFEIFLLNSEQKVGTRGFDTNLPKIAHISLNTRCKA